MNRSLLSLLPVLLITCSAMGKSPPQKNPEGASKSTSQWVEQLGHRLYSKREAASKYFQKQGEKAIPPLTKALNHPDAEVVRRAERVLKSNVNSKLKSQKAKGYQLLTKVAQLPNRQMSQWALDRLSFDSNKEIEHARQALKTLINGKDKKLASIAKNLLIPPLQLLQNRMLDLRAALRAAAQAGNSDEMRKILEEYRAVRSEIRARGGSTSIRR